MHPVCQQAARDAEVEILEDDLCSRPNSKATSRCMQQFVPSLKRTLIGNVLSFQESGDVRRRIIGKLAVPVKGSCARRSTL
jgi:hypothetical protein